MEGNNIHIWSSRPVKKDSKTRKSLPTEVVERSSGKGSMILIVSDR
jgi:hypothetical protein